MKATTLGGKRMGKYMFHATYTQSGLTGLLKEGGTRRRAALTQTIEGMGGRVEVLYYAFGEPDLYIIADLPDDATATAVSLTIGAAGRSQHRRHRTRDTGNRGRGNRKKRTLPASGSLIPRLPGGLPHQAMGSLVTSGPSVARSRFAESFCRSPRSAAAYQAR